MLLWGQSGSSSARQATADGERGPSMSFGEICSQIGPRKSAPAASAALPFRKCLALRQLFGFALIAIEPDDNHHGGGAFPGASAVSAARSACPSLGRPPRLWRLQVGFAISTYQNSGDPNTNWGHWETRRGLLGTPTIKNGDRCGASTNFWELYEEDIERAAAMGANCFRFSLEWSRIEPEVGEVDAAAVQHYHDILDLLHRCRGAGCGVGWGCFQPAAAADASGTRQRWLQPAALSAASATLSYHPTRPPLQRAVLLPTACRKGMTPFVTLHHFGG